MTRSTNGFCSESARLAGDGSLLPHGTIFSFFFWFFSWFFFFSITPLTCLPRRSHSNDDGIILLFEFQKFKTVREKNSEPRGPHSWDKVFGYDKFHRQVPLWHCKHAPRPMAPAWFLPASCRDTSCTTFLSPNINKVANNSTSKGQLAHPKPTGERGTLKEGGARLMAQQESSPYLKRG